MKRVILLLLVFLLILPFGVGYSQTISDRVDWVEGHIPDEFKKPSRSYIEQFIGEYGDNRYLVVLNYYQNYGAGNTDPKTKVYAVPVGVDVWFSKIGKNLFLLADIDDMKKIKVLRESNIMGDVNQNGISSDGYPYSQVEVYVGDYDYVSEVDFNPLEGMIIRMMTPRDGFKDNVSIWNLWIEYQVVMQDGQTPESNLYINILGGKDGGYRDITYHEVTEFEKNKWKGFLKVSVEMAPGENVIEAKLKYFYDLNEYYATDIKTYYYFIGVVDEDGDGIDDRTGRPIYKELEDIPVVGPQIPEGSGVFGYIVWFFESIFWVLGQATDGIRRMFTQIGDFTAIVGQFFNFLPAEFVSMIFIGIMISVVLRVVGR